MTHNDNGRGHGQKYEKLGSGTYILDHERLLLYTAHAAQMKTAFELALGKTHTQLT